MWWRILFALCMLSCAAVSVKGQDVEDIEKILRLTGHDAPEHLDEYEVERLCEFLERPLRINVVSPSAVRSSGLFTPFQAASLIDYRTRHGDVMSFNELASVDGFNEAVVNVLAPFVSLAGGALNERETSGNKVRNDLAVRGGLKFSEGERKGGYGLKYRCEVGERLSFALASSEPYSSDLSFPDTFSGHLSYESARFPLRIILGDFNARFGQGLALWNGMTMSGLSKLSSFYRSASGISPSWSYTGGTAMTGAGVELSYSRFMITGALAMPGIKSSDYREMSFLPVVNVGWYGRNLFLSLTHYLELCPMSDAAPSYIPDMKSSASVSLCLDGTDIFTEISSDWVNRTMAAVVGAITPIGEEARLACQLRFYPSSYDSSRSGASRSGSKCSNEYGASVCLGLASGDISVDAAYFPVPKEDGVRSIQVKALADWDFKLADDILLKVRVLERYRTWGRPSKTDVRTDVAWTPSIFSITARLNVSRCQGFGFLSYVEGGVRSESASIYLRQGCFFIDDWEDRIYAYERDAPGSFSVPSFYGRGLWTSLVSSWRFSRWGRLYFRASMTSYPFMSLEKKKPGKAELKLQFVFSF